MSRVKSQRGEPKRAKASNAPSFLEKAGLSRLTFRVCMFVSIAMFIVFFMLGTIINFIVGHALRQRTDDDLYTNTKANVEKISGLVQKYTALANAVSSNLETDLAAEDTEPTMPSRVLDGVMLSGSRFDAESVMLSVLQTTVKNDPNLIGAGVLLEPGAFSASIDQYAPYVSAADNGSVTISNLSYDSYKDAQSYTTVKETGSPDFSDPVDMNGVKMVSCAFPVTVNGKVVGAVSFDLNLDAFGIIATENETFPSLYVNIINSYQTIMYSTHTNVIGKAYKDTVSADAFASISSSWAAGKQFTVTTSSSSGTVRRYYMPMDANGETWWVQTAVPIKEYNKQANQLVFIVIAIMTLGFIVIDLTVIATVKKSLTPLKGVTDAAKELANGSLSVSVKAETDDEIGTMATEIGIFVDRLKQIVADLSNRLSEVASGNFVLDPSGEELYVGDYRPMLDSIHTITSRLDDTLTEIKVSSSQVNDGASQVSSGAQALAQGSTEQASSVQELSATMTEISDKIKETAEKAGEAEELSNAAGRAVDVSNDKMNEMRDAMKEITAKAEEISKIIKTIDDIAFQTNILSLNASIEAARAGSAGKGFAVVAGEVGNLAKKSQQAAQSTADLIQETVDAVQKGDRITEETAEALNSVSDNTKKVSNLISSISKASEEQSTGVSQVTEGIGQISSVVQTNSATAEQSAAASEELSGQAAVMNDLISKFRLKNDADAPAAPAPKAVPAAPAAPAAEPAAPAAEEKPAAPAPAPAPVKPASAPIHRHFSKADADDKY